MARRTIAVFYGGIGPERKVSLQSGASVLEALRETDWRVFPVEVTADGEFLVEGAVLTAGAAAERLIRCGVEAAFLALHGPYGEDGVLQGFLRTAGIPFTGSDVEGSAIAMNKQASRLILADAGVAVAPGRLIRLGEDPEAYDPLLPAVVKPCRLGSSVGVRIVTDRAACAAAVRDVHDLGQDCLVERYVSGVEYSCPVWHRHGGLLALPIVEIRPGPGRAFFDYHAKYLDEKTRETVHCEETPLFAQLKELAVRAHRAIGGRSFSRTDFIVENGTPYALEVNTIPGLTGNSLVPQSLRAAGFTLADLVTESVEGALVAPAALIRAARAGDALA